MSRRTEQRCAYCGSQSDEITRDHVPPRSIFPDDPAHRVALITVPACRKCNQAFSKDDQYFHIIVAAHAMTTANPISASLHPRAMRGMKRTLYDRIGRTLSRALRRVEVRSDAGLYVGTEGALAIDREALERVAVRIVRGLHYHHFGNPVRPDLAVDCRFLKDIPLRTDDYKLRLQPLRDVLQSAPLHDIGNGVFKYRFRQADDNPDFSAWMMIFYDAMEFSGAIRPRESVPRIVVP